MKNYIWESDLWPDLLWQFHPINEELGEVRAMQGRIGGLMQALGFNAKAELNLSALTLDVVKSSEIEGEILNYDQVRSSIARRLGIPDAGLAPGNRHIEGVVEMMLDATQNYTQPLTEERLFGWHAALFPTGYSGPYKIEVGKYRSGEMQIVSGAMGKEKVHYQAVPAYRVQEDMDLFLEWYNQDNGVDPVLCAALAHFWFIIIHPFDDGNGRIARALTDMLLARAERSSERYYSMSSQIMLERKEYYAVLQDVQHSNGDITKWMQWFMACLKKALLTTELTTQKILRKAEFWSIHESTPINERQRIMLNKILDGLTGSLKTSVWAKITKTSNDTALRDIQDLVNKGILEQTPSKGRSTQYALNQNFKATMEWSKMKYKER